MFYRLLKIAGQITRALLVIISSSCTITYGIVVAKNAVVPFDLYSLATGLFIMLVGIIAGLIMASMGWLDID